MATRQLYMTQQCKILAGAPPLDHNATAMTARYVSLKYYGHLTIMINVGAWAGGTAAVSMLQATDVSATGAKALGFTSMWHDSATDGLLVETAVVANTFNLSAASANDLYVIEVDATSLDTANDFDCVTLVIGTPGANADLYGVMYVLSQPRYAQATPPCALVD